MKNFKLTIIVLHWNQLAVTRACLKSLLEGSSARYQVLLVDNGSVDGSAELLIKEFPQVNLIKNKTNLGFAAGNNVGIKAALASGAERIMLLNNDTIVESTAIFELDRTPFDISSPKIMVYDQPERVWFNGGGFLPVLNKPTHINYYALDNSDMTMPFPTAWISGCCLLAGRQVFEAIGLLDEDYYHGYEDVDWCCRAKQAGFSIGVIPKAKIFHKFAVSAGGKYSAFYTYFRTRNNLLFFRKRKWWFSLLLNLLTFPVYSFLISFKNQDKLAIKATAKAVSDFFFGRYGKGSA